MSETDFPPAVNFKSPNLPSVTWLKMAVASAGVAELMGYPGAPAN